MLDDDRHGGSRSIGVIIGGASASGQKTLLFCAFVFLLCITIFSMIMVVMRLVVGSVVCGGVRLPGGGRGRGRRMHGFETTIETAGKDEG